MIAYRTALGTRGAECLASVLAQQSDMDRDTTLNILSTDLDAARHAIPFLSNLLKDPEPAYRLRVARILIAGGEPQPQALRVFREALRAQDAVTLQAAVGEIELLGPWLDAVAAWALGQVGVRDERVLLCLNILRSAPDRGVSRAADALAQLAR